MKRLLLSGALATEGFESLLDLMLGFFLPWSLDWHYRSKDERLIAFANHHVYGDRLVTLPSARTGPPIAHALVAADEADGQEESPSPEVEQVVQLVLEYAETQGRKPPDERETLGVITLGIKHASRIEAALDRARLDRPELDSFFDGQQLERFFVKNLERVQGDERDAIILAIGAGKGRGGRLDYRAFGPLNSDGGRRRLNVAITRARCRMTVVSSFTHADMDPERVREGTALLRDYLQYAGSGGENYGDGRASPVPLNPFEADVAETLERAGVPVISQWGASKYRIDLVAKHPERPGEFVLAIECDGASYHSAPTARDRDRLRQQHLEALGWRFHRIWSSDWFQRREDEIQRARAAYTAAVAAADGGRITPQESPPVSAVDTHPVDIFRNRGAVGYPACVGGEAAPTARRGWRVAGDPAPRHRRAGDDEPMIARYIHLRRHPRVFVAMTGLQVAEFDELVRDVRPQYEQAETARLSRAAAVACPKHRRKRAIGAGHPFTLDVRDQILLLVVWLRLYPTYAVLAYLFGVSEAAVSRIRARVLPVLEQAGLATMHEARARLATLAQAQRDRPPRSRRGMDDVLRDVPDLVVLIDTFEQRVQRPQGEDADGKRVADGCSSGKKKQHTLKTQVALSKPTQEILDVPPSVPGPTSDIKLLERSGTLQQVPDGVGAMGDLAYVGMGTLAPPGVPTVTPRRKPRGQPRPEEDIAYNTAVARERIDVEHGIGRMRHYQAITQTDRHHRRHHMPRTRAIAGLANRQVRSRRRLRLGGPR